MTRPVAVVRVTPTVLRAGGGIALWPGDPRIGCAFALHPAEERFARAVIERHANLWVVRTDQRTFSGDFVVVDMSSPRPERRPVLVLELKQGARVRLASPTSHQLQNAADAVAATARLTGVIPEEAEPLLLIGDPDALLVALGVKKRRRRRRRRADRRPAVARA